MAYDATGICDALLPLPTPAHALKNATGGCADGRDAIRNRPMDHPLRGPIQFARAGQMFTGSAAAASPALIANYQGNDESKLSERDPQNLTIFQWQCLPENKHVLHRFGCGMKAKGDFPPPESILNGERRFPVIRPVYFVR
jgi:hypothetical protein